MFRIKFKVLAALICVFNIFSALAQVSGSGTSGTVPRWTAPTTLGNSSIQDDGSVTTVKTLNKVIYADSQTGLSADAKIANAIAALPSTGGTVDARGFGCTTQTWASSLTVGTVTKPVTLLIDRCTEFDITVSDGSSAIVVAPKSGIVAFGGSKHVPAQGFNVTNSANIASVITNNKTDSSAGRVYLEGFQVWGCGGSGSCIVANGLVDFDTLTDNSVMKNVIIANPKSEPSLKLTRSQIDIFSCSIDGGGRSNPVVVRGAGSISAINFFGGSYAHAGTNQAIFDIGSVGGGLNFHGVQIESDGTAAGNIGFLINDSRGVTLTGVSVTAAGSATAADVVKITNTGNLLVGSGGVVLTNLENFDVPNWTNTVNDQVNNIQLPAPTYGHLPLWIMKGRQFDNNSFIGALTFQGFAFSNLPSAMDGTIVYCVDCVKANSCAAGGSGAFAKKRAGSWDCN